MVARMLSLTGRMVYIFVSTGICRIMVRRRTITSGTGCKSELAFRQLNLKSKNLGKTFKLLLAIRAYNTELW